ncbi:hypothetical protein [Streptomyces sp. NPDC047928]
MSTIQPVTVTAEQDFLLGFYFGVAEGSGIKVSDIIDGCGPDLSDLR